MWMFFSSVVLLPCDGRQPQLQLYGTTRGVRYHSQPTTVEVALRYVLRRSIVIPRRSRAVLLFCCTGSPSAVRPANMIVARVLHLRLKRRLISPTSTSSSSACWNAADGLSTCLPSRGRARRSLRGSMLPLPAAIDEGITARPRMPRQRLGGSSRCYRAGTAKCRVDEAKRTVWCCRDGTVSILVSRESACLSHNIFVASHTDLIPTDDESPWTPQLTLIRRCLSARPNPARQQS